MRFRRRTQCGYWEVTAVCAARPAAEFHFKTEFKQQRGYCQCYTITRTSFATPKTSWTPADAGQSYLPAGWVLDESTALLVSQRWCPSRHFLSDRIKKANCLFSCPHSSVAGLLSSSVSSGLEFTCLLRWFQDHHLATCNVTGWSDFNLCAFNGARLLQTFPQPTLASIRILLRFYVKELGPWDKLSTWKAWVHSKLHWNLSCVC